MTFDEEWKEMGNNNGNNCEQQTPSRQFIYFHSLFQNEPTGYSAHNICDYRIVFVPCYGLVFLPQDKNKKL